MSTIVQTQNDLFNHFNEQLELLSVLAQSYDSGSEVAAKSMATCVRVLLHNTDRSFSLLKQLGLDGSDIFDTCAEIEGSPTTGAIQIGSSAGLVALALGEDGKGRYIPYLDETPPFHGKKVPFKDYWGAVVFTDNFGAKFTRKDIVLTVANQDGGAHIDPQIDEKYVQLSRKNSMGWEAGNDHVPSTAPIGPELAAIRQIGHEILRTFLPGYPKKKLDSKGAIAVMAGSGIMIGKQPPLHQEPRSDIPPGLFQAAPKALHSYVKDFCQTISSEQLVYIPIKDEKGNTENECIWNVRHQVEKSGGDVVLGWNISEWYGIMLEASFHAVWRAPSGELIDLTPNEANKDKTLFLPNKELVYEEKQIDSILHPLISDSRLDEFIANQHEIFTLENTGDRASKHGQIILSQKDADRRGELKLRQNELMFMVAATSPGRNDYCRCGSGLKHKKCHGK
jgi:hypothetical protein